MSAVAFVRTGRRGYQNTQIFNDGNIHWHRKTQPVFELYPFCTNDGN